MPDYIPGVIQLQILKHLPVISLLRFRCVCKSWKELIDSNSFVQDHLAVQKRGFLVRYEGPELLVLDPLALPDASKEPLQYTGYWIIGTLHGIVCLVNGEDGIRLWNPSTRKVVSVPCPRDHWCEDNDELTTTYTSFWVDPSTKHFKIFVVLFGDGEEGEGYLYSSVHHEWKTFDLPELRYHKPLQECPALVVAEVAYWRAEIRYNDEYIDDVVVVWSFDFGQETFDVIEAPLVRTEDESHPMMCDWQGILSLLYLDEDMRCDVYLRQGGSWLHTFRLSLPSNVGCVLWVVREMEEKCRVLVEEDGHSVLATVSSELVLCDTGDGCGTTKSGLEGKITHAQNKHWYNVFFVAYGFVESLLTLMSPGDA